MLKLIEFMKENENWRELLIQDPYWLDIKYDTMFGRNLAIFRYNPSKIIDFDIELVRECRGIIIDVDTLEPISVPFFKFGNYGESYCPEIDWESAKVLTKVDGSLVKIVNLDGNLLISTNKTIDANKAPISDTFGCPYNSYKELILDAFPIKGLSEEYMCQHIFEEGYTYMFELTSIYNKVVIPYDGINLTFIGIRNNKTLQEEYIKNHPLSLMFMTPKEYGFKSLDDCIIAAKELPYTEEGYVVVDKNFNRVKVKSPAYVAIHHLKGEQILTKKKALELVLKYEMEEFLNYFPEYIEVGHAIQASFNSLCHKLDSDWELFNNNDIKNHSRKEIAEWILKNSFYPAFIFNRLDNKCKNALDFLKQSGKIDLIYNLMDDLNND